MQDHQLICKDFRHLTLIENDSRNNTLQLGIQL